MRITFLLYLYIINYCMLVYSILEMLTARTISTLVLPEVLQYSNIPFIVLPFQKDPIYIPAIISSTVYQTILKSFIFYLIFSCGGSSIRLNLKSILSQYISRLQCIGAQKQGLDSRPDASPPALGCAEPPRFEPHSDHISFRKIR